MANLNYDGAKFVYTEKGRQQVLLDCGDLFANKSRISMHHLPGQSFLTIPELLVGLVRTEQENGAGLELPISIVNILLAKQLSQTSQPVRVLEYGCGDGKLSFHLAKLLGAFHEESSLVCAYNTMDELWMQWMERIAGIEKLPKISYLAGDYGCLQLQKDYFDVVVINGMTNFLDPLGVIEDALSLAARDGILICYTDATPLLESVFKLYFETRDEYEVTPFQKVLLAKVKNQSWAKEPEIDVDALGQKDLTAARKLLNQKAPNRKELSQLVDKLRQDTLTAAKLGRIDWKLRLLKEKEALVERAVSLQQAAKK